MVTYVSSLRAGLRRLIHRRFGVGGIILLLSVATILAWFVVTLIIHADTTTTASFQAEAGTKTGVITIADASAAGGNAIQFGSVGTGLPAQCASGGAYLWNNLETCGWPGTTNTGVPAGVVLTNTTGRTITTANTIIDGQNITGSITINTTGVIIRNSKINYTGSGGGGSGAIKVLANATATIENVEINGQGAVHTCVWHEGSSIVVRKVNCHDVEDGMFSWGLNTGSAISGNNFTIEDNYIHNLRGNESNGHYDGWQTEGAANGLIRHNTFYTSTDGTSLIAIWNTHKNSTDITVENNLMAGGGFSIYAQDYHPSEANPSGGYTVTNIAFKDNKFSTILDTRVGGYGVWFYRAGWQPYQGGPTDGWNIGGSTRTGNRILETGFNLDSGNPAGCT
jgi:hypothetical protein